LKPAQIRAYIAGHKFKSKCWHCRALKQHEIMKGDLLVLLMFFCTWANARQDVDVFAKHKAEVTGVWKSIESKQDLAT
jgi:hypothetical protein